MLIGEWVAEWIPSLNLTHKLLGSNPGNTCFFLFQIQLDMIYMTSWQGFASPCRVTQLPNGLRNLWFFFAFFKSILQNTNNVKYLPAAFRQRDLVVIVFDC